MRPKSQVNIVRVMFPATRRTTIPRPTHFNRPQRGHEGAAHISLVTRRLTALLAVRTCRFGIGLFAPGLQQVATDLEHAAAHQLLGLLQIIQHFWERLSQRSQLLLTPLDFHNQRLLDRLGDIRCTHGRILVALMEIEHALTCPSTPFLSNHPTFAPQDLSRTQQSGQLHVYHELVRPLAHGRPIRLEFAVLTKTRLPELTCHQVPPDHHSIERTRRIVARVWEGMQAA